MIARRCSKTVAFVAILALTTFGALATASAQPADIKAIDKAFQDYYSRGNYPAAHTDAQELERRVKARFGTDHPGYAVALNKLAIVFLASDRVLAPCIWAHISINLILEPWLLIAAMTRGLNASATAATRIDHRK